MNNINVSEISAVLENYCKLPALSGYEKLMAKALSEDLKPYCDELKIDRAGNVIGTIKGTDKDAPHLTILSQMDSAGFLVKEILPSGLLRLEKVGEIADKVVAGNAMLVGNEAGEYFEGTVTVASYGGNSAKDRVTVDPLSVLLVDIGTMNEAETRALGINIGCPVVFHPVYLPMANDRVISSYLSARSGCTALVFLARELSKNRPACTVNLVGSVMEEFNMRGGIIASRTTPTDIAINISWGITSDTCETRMNGNSKLGGGSVVSMFNFHGNGTLNGCIPQKGLYELARKCADEEGLGFQRSAGRGIITDTAYMQLEGRGIPCVDINIPLRYANSPSEVADLKDIASTVKLLAAMAKKIGKDYDLNRFD